MNVILVWLLPIALTALECRFLRRCVLVRQEGDFREYTKHRVPRAMAALLLLLSLVPVLGWVVVIATLLVSVVQLCSHCWEVIPNRFTSYWLNAGDNDFETSTNKKNEI